MVQPPEQVRAHLGARPGILLKEKGHTLGAALVADAFRPLASHGPVLWSRLSAHNGPVDASQVERSEVFEQRFKANKLRQGAARSNRVNP